MSMIIATHKSYVRIRRQRYVIMNAHAHAHACTCIRTHIRDFDTYLYIDERDTDSVREPYRKPF